MSQKTIGCNSVNEFVLLDCSKNCTTGTLNEACDACTCSNHLLTGRVLTEDDVPLSEANISLAETPYNVLAQTNVSGFFTVLGVCAGQQELLVTKAGFVPVTQNATLLTPTTASITLKLEIAGKHPGEGGGGLPGMLIGDPVFWEWLEMFFIQRGINSETKLRVR